ncbi:MAG: autotransporter strand-loop-strand O-heptosyltransferase [Selenomonadaceae bacterium]|nr:autotransporter strand-loop-strand O-heptosyltransferase [Selenomonadaceae bacterium]
MKLHFFTVNDIEDYRIIYPHAQDVKDFKKTFKGRAPKDFDQVFLKWLIRKLYRFSEETFESKIYGETGIDGLRLDFNFGLRLDVPKGNFYVRVKDADTEKIFFEKNLSGVRLLSVENYFVRYHVDVFLDGKNIFSHTLNLEGQPVALIEGERFVLGDSISFLTYLREFQRVHRCKLFVRVPEKLRQFAAHLYPDIIFFDQKDFDTYATYYLVMVMSPFPITPCDYRYVSMTRTGGALLGISYIPPKAIFEPTAPPVTDEPYVCIAVQATTPFKTWLWPGGWDIVIEYLKQLGYRVFCIDKNKEETHEGYTVCMPEGAEDFTGDRPIIERANMLYHAEFFIGLGSGLSWLADAVDCPVVMIAGFSQDWCEFYTPYRVANRNVCNGCFNNPVVNYPSNPCKFHRGTPREAECQKEISPIMVIDAIERLIVDRNLTPPLLKNL